MRESVTIKLARPVLWHDQTIREIVVEEPTGSMLLKHGNAVTWSQSSGGNTLSVEDPDVIRSYVEGCIKHDGGAALFALLSLEDAMVVRDRVIGFFHRRSVRGMVANLDLLVFELRIASAAEALAMPFSEIDFWIARGLAAGKLKRK